MDAPTRTQEETADTAGMPAPPSPARPGEGAAGGRQPRLRIARTGAEPADEALLKLAYHQHGQAVMAYATRLLHDRERAADLVQEAFLRLWRHPEVLAYGFDGLRGWLLVVVRNIVRDRARAAAVRVREVSDGGLADDVAADEPDHAERVAAALTVATAMQGLSEAHRTVLEHLYWHDESVKEAAAALGVPVGTVKSRSYYALGAIREVLERGKRR